ncbi:MAG: response regulator [Actinobacteria bacterium]|nr:response regulator [Actinomycetota bacterium]PLS86452.1 MAG: response regulator [Actinomycetota bacterium]
METTPLIVVADDDQDILNLVGKRLAKRGYHVVTATDGQQALELIRSRRPAAAILDWMMPVLQGPEVCSRLKDDPSTEGVPVVLLTAKVSDIDIEKGFRVGADDYITKPFDIVELDMTLKRLIGNNGR